ncbi:MAG TPA: S9 family peptidase, partial [Bacteroidia bacterium]|nr:S9 family peptidase [Bacteroidia bacterium]
MISKNLFPLLLLSLAIGCKNSEQKAEQKRLVYPVTKKTDTVDTYFNTKVADPYRWLEDDKSTETSEWVKTQNALTFDYLSKIP